MEELAGLVLKRKSITRIWNHADQYKFSILWEYTSPAAYQKCQKVIAKRICQLPIAMKLWRVRIAACRSSTGAVMMHQG